jgi:hypothetical protein
MSGSATDYLEGKLLAHSLGITAYPMPVTLCVGLCQNAPTDTTAGTPPPGGAGYARITAAFAMGSGQPSNAANSASVQFAAATADWGGVGWFELWDALTAGNRLYWGPLVDPANPTVPIVRTVLAGDILRLPAGALVVSAD